MRATVARSVYLKRAGWVAREERRRSAEDRIEEEEGGPGRSKHSRLRACIKYDICLLNL